MARGHQVSLFRRGLSSPGLFPEAEHLTGDRTGSLAALEGRRWDVVFDPSGYQPAHVRAAARAVSGPDVHYVFVSSISVYADFSRPNRETSAVHALVGGEETEALDLDAYGRLKVACERAVEEVLPGRVQIVRAGLIVGPHDYDRRFAWWLRRLARGGDVVAPGRPDAPVQLVDARDLAAWMVSCAEQRIAGAFNATGPAEPHRLDALLATLAEAVGAAPRFVWVPDELLLAEKVAPVSDMPFWVPARFTPLFQTDVSRALATGLAFRPLAETAADTWRWLADGWAREEPVRVHRTLHVPAGISAEVEARLLSAERRPGSRPA